MRVRKLALKNVYYQRVQTMALWGIYFIITLGVFAGSYFRYSLKNGLEVAADRIGADILVVPDKFVTNAYDSLFLGKACTINFNSNWEEKIGAIEGVEHTSSQLFLASIGSLDCCDGTVQLIAFDVDSDFTILPWVSCAGINKLKKNEILVGSNINKKRGEIVTYFGRKFIIKGVLDESGLGYDSSMFISYEAAYEIALDKAYSKMLPFTNAMEVISMVLIDVEEGYSLDEVSKNIKKQYGNNGISIYTTSTLLGDFSTQFKQFNIYGWIFITLIVIMAIVSLGAIITITFNIRRNELGSLLSVGIRKSILIKMFLWEATYVLLPATLIGIITICFIVIPFHNSIRLLLTVPFHKPSNILFFLFGLKTMLINIIVYLVAASISFYSIYKLNPADLVKE